MVIENSILRGMGSKRAEDARDWMIMRKDVVSLEMV